MASLRVLLSGPHFGHRETAVLRPPVSIEGEPQSPASPRSTALPLISYLRRGSCVAVETGWLTF